VNINNRNGGIARYTVTIARTNGFNSPVSLSISGLPSGGSGSFKPNPATTSSALTVNVGASVAKGTYTFTVTGTGGSPTITHTAQAKFVKKH
jgi:serine protease